MTRTTKRWLLILLGFSGFFAFVWWYILSRSWEWNPWFLSWLFGINLVSFFAYGWDKRQANREGNRIPEAALHTVTGLGGGIGAYLGMRVFRHKTIKSEFRIVFWLMVTIQILLLIWLLKVTWF
jgi:uncharacterized membrane protein YsdA (DUF1294 family)